MSTIVLVHGTTAGGWTWRRVAPELRAAGHHVTTPTLTGLGERVHLATPAVDLDTNIADVVNHLIYEELDNVILVGHSYGGMVIAGVADRVPERVAQLIFLQGRALDLAHTFRGLTADQEQQFTDIFNSAKG